MSDGPSEDLFAPEIFFRRAAARLRSAPPEAAESSSGDHGLNPGYVPPENVRYKEAAVLIPVVARQPQAAVILTLRTASLRDHSGQIAFPGGKIGPEDGGPGATALREAEEEIGLPACSVSVVGYLDAYLTGTGFRVIPVVGRVAPDHPLAVNPEEVEAAFEVPLSFLMSPENHRIGSREFRGIMRHFYEMPFGDRYIWGATAGIIRALYERVYA
jgi:8-oxo-dGTP pyrophosphatase MutT (NUDIX family)